MSNYAVVVDISGIPLVGSKGPVIFPHVNDTCAERIDLSLGYATREVKKLASNNSELGVKWTGSYQHSFECLSVYWETTKDRKNTPGKKDPATNCCRGLSELSVGVDYIAAGIVHGSTELSTNIDFGSARKMFKQ